MRLILSLLVLLAAPLSAQAAVVWAESTPHNAPVTSWSRGATLEEAHGNLGSYIGTKYHVLLACRQKGWFAYVGADGDTRRGVSCGFETKSAALYKAKQECAFEGGRCILERVGYDDGEKTRDALPSNSVSASLPGGDEGAPFNVDMGPVSLTDGTFWGSIEKLF